MTGLRVLKFGGTSVAHAQAEVVRRIAEAQSQHPTLVVVSAFAGLTDQLLKLADGRGPTRDLDELIRDLAQRCGDAESPHLGDLRRLAGRSAAEGGLRGAARDALLAVGERLAAEAIVRALRQSGVAARAVDGTEVLVACGRTGRVDLDLSSRKATSCLAELGTGSPVPVVTGFVAGVRDSGHAVTLGRGASDLSATLLASFLGAQEVEIWTDTDGIWSADPNRLEAARPIRCLGYGEASSMARWGAKVLHPETVEPVASRGIPVRVRSIFEPDAEGSRIEAQNRLVRAVARLPSAPVDELAWIAAIGADPETFSPDLPDPSVVSRLVERAEGDRPRVEAVLVPIALADEVEKAFHRELVERWEVEGLRRIA